MEPKTLTTVVTVSASDLTSRGSGGGRPTTGPTTGRTRRTRRREGRDDVDTTSTPTNVPETVGPSTGVGRLPDSRLSSVTVPSQRKGFHSYTRRLQLSTDLTLRRCSQWEVKVVSWTPLKVRLEHTSWKNEVKE